MLTLFIRITFTYITLTMDVRVVLFAHQEYSLPPFLILICHHQVV